SRSAGQRASPRPGRQATPSARISRRPPRIPPRRFRPRPPSGRSLPRGAEGYGQDLTGVAVTVTVSGRERLISRAHEQGGHDVFSIRIRPPKGRPGLDVAPVGRPRSLPSHGTLVAYLA